MTCFSKILFKNEADAEAMTVLSMYNFKEKFGWDEPYDNAKTVNLYEKGLAQAFEDGLGGSKDTYKATKEAFKACYTTHLNIKKGDVISKYWRKDDYVESMVNADDFSKTRLGRCIDSKGYDLNNWLEQYKMPKEGGSYLMTDDMKTFLGKNENCGITQKTHDVLVKRLKEHFGEDKKSFEAEKLKLPKVYEDKGADKIKGNKKDGASLMKRTKKAQEKFVYYKNKCKASNVRAIKMKQKLLSNRRS
jgi:hypothetical protein